MPFLTINSPISYQSNVKPVRREKRSSSMGYGNRFTYKTTKNDETTPGPKYLMDFGSISRGTSSLEKRTESTFGSKYDKYEKCMHKGQEAHYYGKQGAPPGSYNTCDNVGKNLKRK